ncbi:GMC family oxidoreductase [Microbulbifer sp. ZKSA006]|uniref:GMC family oxidoreductase n=1 Tax=Microbulbifer sp. ZKSA006 TaxID=3243390 RepID=UPI004039C36B
MEEKDKVEKKSSDRKISRRSFTKRAVQLGIAASAASTGLVSALSMLEGGFYDLYDYVIVGSGAGGGPLAVNLAKAGFSVLVLEAGANDPSDDTHNIPAWHPFASEDRKLSWDFYVKHYADINQQQLDDKYVAGKGILYPRASTIGGCTTHHALITVYPHNSDFDRIARDTGDISWDSANMRQYFERLERCEYVPRPIFSNPSRHGFDGWLPTNRGNPALLLEDPTLLKIVQAALAKYGLEGALEQIVNGNLRLDINHWDVAAGQEGPFVAPMAADSRSQRTSVREHLLAAQAIYPNLLHIRTNSLATRVLFEEKTVIGVEFLEGASLYKADPYYEENGSPGVLRQVRASREVILSGGAFNSPQLLKLSGIGPAHELRDHGIEPLVDLPGVGENLQDRYEVGVVSEMSEDLSLLKDCTWGEGDDPCLNRYRYGWLNQGPYSGNGPVLSLVKRSRPDLEDPDLFIFGVPTDFHGYFPGYSQALRDYKDRFSWVVLKGHTNNTAGRVTLRSADPRDTPEINFHYFAEGNDALGEDLQAVIEGVKISRDIMSGPIVSSRVSRELLPGSEVQSDPQIGDFVKNQAWGHHASCSNKMGPASDPMAVVDSKFRVHGTHNLRVVDASVFPRIPGFFIVVPVYMISEKASDDIIAAATGGSV